jgi:hypothetical protein
MKNRAVVTFGGSFKYRIYIFINILSSTGLLACIMMTGPDTELGNSEHLQDIGNIQLYQKQKKHRFLSSTKLIFTLLKLKDDVVGRFNELWYFESSEITVAICTL